MPRDQIDVTLDFSPTNIAFSLNLPSLRKSDAKESHSVSIVMQLLGLQVQIVPERLLINFRHAANYYLNGREQEKSTRTQNTLHPKYYFRFPSREFQHFYMFLDAKKKKCKLVITWTVTTDLLERSVFRLILLCVPTAQLLVRVIQRCTNNISEGWSLLVAVK